MADSERTTTPGTGGLKKATKIAVGIVVALLAVLLLLAICVRIYLASALPAPLLSKLVTSYLHQQFTVQKLQLADGSLVLKGVRLQNPAGFAQTPLVAADSVAVAPDWLDLLRGRQRFRRIALVGVAVNVEKNPAGAWNYGQLQRLLAARKPSPTETVIGQLVIKDAALNVQGEGVQGISLQVYNLTTKGSAESNLKLTFQDPAGNVFQVKGKGRPGTDAAVDLTISAPSLSLKQTAAFFRFKDPGRFEGGTGALGLDFSLHKGELRCSGEFSFRGIRLPAKVPYPVSGTLQVAADYNTRTDSGRLQRSTLTIDKLASLHAEGSVNGLKQQRQFSLLLGMDDFDLRTLNVLLPDQLRKGALLAGRLRCQTLKIAGSPAQGMTAAGVLDLQEGAISRNGQLLVAGVAGRLDFSRSRSGIVGKGKLSVAGRHDQALVEALDLTLAATLSPKLKPISAEVPAFSARVMAIPLQGRLSYAAGKPAPLAAVLTIPSVRLSALNAQFKRFGLEAAAGTGSITLDVTGKGAQDVGGTVQLQVADFRGTLANKPLSLASGKVTAAGERKGGAISAHGNAEVRKLSADGKGGDAGFAFTFADDLLQLQNVRASALGAEVVVARLATRIPRGGSDQSSGLPVSVDLSGCTVTQRQAALVNLSGRVRGSYHAGQGGKWLEGTADLSSGSLVWQGKRLGAPSVHALFSKGTSKTDLGGDLLGGKLTGAASLNPFSPGSGVTFDARVAGADVAAGALFIPKADTVKPSEGRLDLHLSGGYTARGGLSCRFDAKGSGVAFTGTGGKRLVSGTGLTLSGGLTGGDLSLREGSVSLAPDVSLRVAGDIAQLFTAKRAGVLSFSMPVAAVNSVIDPLVNVVPRLLQEATLDGRIGAEGKLTLKEGRQLLEGAVAVSGGQFSVPAQKLVMADINGKIPFSLDLSRKGARPEQSMSFSRDNYWKLLGQLRKASGGESFVIRKLAFGPVEFGTMTIQLAAVDGVTRLTSLKSSLFLGEVLGKGYVTIGNKIVYRGDLLIHNLSLLNLCSVFPNIAGYISGRVDGVVSLSGQGNTLADITGFMELWAREKRGEKMVVSKEFLQRLAKQKLAGFFFSSNRPYDEAEIKAELEEGNLTFDKLLIQHTNFFGVRDLSVSVAPQQNQIALDHLLDSIKEATVRGKAKASTGAPPTEAPAAPAAPTGPQAPAGEAPATEFKWGE